MSRSASGKPSQAEIAKRVFQSMSKKRSNEVSLASYIVCLACSQLTDSFSLTFAKATFKSKTKGIATLNYDADASFDFSKLEAEKIEDCVFDFISQSQLSAKVIDGSAEACESVPSTLPLGVAYCGCPSLRTVYLSLNGETVYAAAIVGDVPEISSIKAVKVLKLGHKKTKNAVEVFFEIGEGPFATISDRRKAVIEELAVKAKRTVLQRTTEALVTDILSTLKQGAALSGDIAADSELMSELTEVTYSRLNHFQNVTYSRGLFAALGKTAP